MMQQEIVHSSTSGWSSSKSGERCVSGIAMVLGGICKLNIQHAKLSSVTWYHNYFQLQGVWQKTLNYSQP